MSTLAASVGVRPVLIRNWAVRVAVWACPIQRGHIASTTPLETVLMLDMGSKAVTTCESTAALWNPTGIQILFQVDLHMSFHVILLCEALCTPWYFTLDTGRFRSNFQLSSTGVGKCGPFITVEMFHVLVHRYLKAIARLLSSVRCLKKGSLSIKKGLFSIRSLKRSLRFEGGVVWAIRQRLDHRVGKFFVWDARLLRHDRIRWCPL